MARPEKESYRDEWWEKRLKDADTPKKKLTVYMNKLLADISRLPDHHQDPARELAVLLMSGVVDEIEIKTTEEAWA